MKLATLFTDPAGVAQPILTRLHEDLDALPPALGRVAKYVLENPEKVVQITIAELGALSESGEASVIRLCRALAFHGFRQFKVALAGELGRSAVPRDQDRRGIVSDVEAIHRSLSALLNETARELDSRSISEVVDCLARARRVDVYGAGMSGIVGEIFAYRLLRLRVNAQAFRDAHMAHEVAHGLQRGDVAVAVSESGLTPDTVRFLQTAKRASATTIAILTRRKGPLADAADIVLRVPPALHRPTTDAIASVPAKILLLEVIATALSVGSAR